MSNSELQIPRFHKPTIPSPILILNPSPKGPYPLHCTCTSLLYPSLLNSILLYPKTLQVYFLSRNQRLRPPKWCSLLHGSGSEFQEPDSERSQHQHHHALNHVPYHAQVMPPKQILNHASNHVFKPNHALKPHLRTHGSHIHTRARIPYGYVGYKFIIFVIRVGVRLVPPDSPSQGSIVLSISFF